MELFVAEQLSMVAGSPGWRISDDGQGGRRADLD
jgi:hypothetical protein